MFLNTSFKFRKNHLYKQKTYFCPQNIVTNHQVTSPVMLSFTSLKSTVTKQNRYTALRRQLGRKTEKLFRMVFAKKPYLMVTAKPREIRMGKGKGAFSHVHLPVRCGTLLFTLHWCHKLAPIPFFYYLKQANKKTGLSLVF
jgi:ribosomal protein L16/L10AE